MTRLKPAPGYVLVKLIGYYENIPLPEQKYNRHTNGICVAVNDSVGLAQKHLLNNRVFWEELQASEIIEHEGEKYCFIKAEDIRGFETDQKIS